MVLGQSFFLWTRLSVWGGVLVLIWELSSYHHISKKILWKYYYATISISSPTNSGVKISVSLKGSRIGNNICTPFLGLAPTELFVSKKSKIWKFSIQVNFETWTLKYKKSIFFTTFGLFRTWYEQMCPWQVFAWLPEHLQYKILSNNEFKRRNDFKFQPLHWFLLVLHYYKKKNQPKTPNSKIFCQFRVLWLPEFFSTINFHQLGPLGRVGLVVAMSVCLCVCVFVCLSPSHAIFLK